MKFKYLTKEEVSKLPKTSGIYVFRKGKEFLYIGKAANIRERVKNHFQQPAYRDGLFLGKVGKIGYLRTDSEIEALILEAKLIKKYQPRYNVLWRDDKNYFYVVKTQEDFPRIFIAHQIKTKESHVGPFVDGKALKQTLKVLRKIFPYRSCFKIPNRPCLWYHLNRCLAPCLLKSKTAIKLPKFKSRLKRRECRVYTKNLMEILQGKKTKVLKNLKKEMEKASAIQDFETAAKVRDQIAALEKIIQHAKIFEFSENLLLQPQVSKSKWKETEGKLRKIVRSQKEISRIEAYDVSHIQGQEATGSMITFINGLPDKNFYRRFKIKIVGKPDDLAMLRECLERRFKHKEWPYPDLIFIDGGKSQLNVAINSKLKIADCKQIKVIAITKRENELFVEGQEKPIWLKNLPREIFNLILQLRDEAHRFAREYHLRLREKECIILNT